MLKNFSDKETVIPLHLNVPDVTGKQVDSQNFGRKTEMAEKLLKSINFGRKTHCMVNSSAVFDIAQFLKPKTR